MNILVFRESFDKWDPDQPVKVYLGTTDCSREIVLSDREKEDIGRALFSAIGHSGTVR